MKYRYLFIIEPTTSGISAYSLVIPGCVSTGCNREEILMNMKEDVAFHVEGLKIEGISVPQPCTEAIFCEL
ncbi:MAG TPA: type II toxin-antitoxin system HicB family antitoxin [Verrucomicrobiales bacterium]|nr:type II toxin-antitoxin system HicB family antitoxin [Verrucomicrobiales bacterium]HIL69096.1 type II toxin-antitoxin system HicB family antitoxin [Verrucomicrobiota bacterium]